ncbi:MAG TPA: glycosyltransferase family 1 protein [Nitrospiria bacterium]|nr:glycosyltransferase family 1 protein [Nitrospiria bacterium]
MSGNGKITLETALKQESAAPQISTMRLFFTHDVFSTQKVGGMSRYFVEVIKRIRRMDRESIFEICGGLFINQHLKGLPVEWGIKVPSVRNTGIFRKKVNNWFQERLIRRKAPEVIHQTYYSDFPFRNNLKVVITVPDMIHELYPESFSDKGTTSVLKKRCCDRADKIIAVSNTTKKDLVRSFGIEPRKVQVIYLANPLEGVAPDLKRKPLAINYILYVGDRHGYKNFKFLIQAYAHSKKVHERFQLVCFGGGVFSVGEKAQISDLGIDENVIQVSGNDGLLALYYRNARAFVYPSLYEGFGLPVLEAMSYGCPVICSTGGAIPEIVGNAGIYFDPESSESIQVVLEKSLFDDSLIKEMVVRGRKRVKEFSWEKCARETLEVYKSLADLAGPRSD